MSTRENMRLIARAPLIPINENLIEGYMKIMYDLG